MTFALDPRIVRDTLPIGDLDLCRLLLMNDRAYPWLLLVPRRDGLTEIIDLGEEDRAILMKEIAAVSSALKAVATPDKLNVASLGNMVRQLHVHVVARNDGDPAWPGPVWGHGSAVPYDPSAAATLTARIAAALGPALQLVPMP